MPLKQLTNWINEERTGGAPDPMHAVLATTSNDVPHSRVISIKSITENGLREVILDGLVDALSEDENRQQ